MLPITLTFFARTQVNLRAQVWTSNQMHILNKSLLYLSHILSHSAFILRWWDDMRYIIDRDTETKNHLPFLPASWPSQSHLLLQIVFNIAKLLSCTVDSTKEVNNNLYFLCQNKMICIGEKLKTSSWRQALPEIFLLLLFLGIFCLFVRAWNFS